MQYYRGLLILRWVIANVWVVKVNGRCVHVVYNKIEGRSHGDEIKEPKISERQSGQGSQASGSLALIQKK